MGPPHHQRKASVQLHLIFMKKKVAITMELEWPYKRHYEVFAGIRDYATEQGGWEFCISNYPQFEIERGVRYDGVIGRISAECLQAAKKTNAKVVNVMVDSPVQPLTSGVYPDFRSAGFMAAEHLINRGLKRIVHFGFKRSRASRLHYEGMREIAKQQNRVCKRHLVESSFAANEGNWSRFVEITMKAISTWQMPIGIAFSSDELAYAVSTLCVSHGFRIPDQIVAIGTNNETIICNAGLPTLSSIDMSDRHCGYEAARMLDEMMNSQTKRVERIRYVPPKELVLRRSSNAYAVDDSALTKALAFMANNLHLKISVMDIAKAAGIGRQSLEHRFRKKLQRTVNDELIRLRISKMKRLLVESSLTIAEISYQCGFGTTANMHVIFKRHTQMTPASYREKHNP